MKALVNGQEIVLVDTGKDSSAGNRLHEGQFTFPDGSKCFVKYYRKNGDTSGVGTDPKAAPISPTVVQERVQPKVRKQAPATEAPEGLGDLAKLLPLLKMAKAQGLI